MTRDLHDMLGREDGLGEVLTEVIDLAEDLAATVSDQTISDGLAAITVPAPGGALMSVPAGGKRWERIIPPGAGGQTCMGPPGVVSGYEGSTCDGVNRLDFRRGRAARWLWGSRPLCGTCKKKIQTAGAAS